ncbi:MAG: trypsin-like serine protease [Clostridia bacterium]|nr:trypsin-like serine protease [Clostridia bacterium]
MKKIVAFMLCVSMVLTFVLSVDAIVPGEDAASASTRSFSAITKDMDTGEITQTLYNEKMSVIDVLSGLNPEDLGAFIDNESVLQPSAIIDGTDSRQKVSNTEQSPNSAICYMEMEIGGTTYTGTAFMVSKNVALTAGHNLYDNFQMASEVKVWPGKNGYGLWNNPYGTAKKLTILTPTYDTNTNEKYDWGIIVLKENIGDDCGWLELTYDHGSVFPVNMTLTGYTDDYYQYTATDQVVNIDSHLLYHRIDSSGGQSGSPIYDSNNKVHAIHGGGYNETRNRGVLITEEIYTYVQSTIASHA